MSTANTAQTTQTIAEIAATILGIEDLATQNRDELDFHELAGWTIKRALEAAYEAGRTGKQAQLPAFVLRDKPTRLSPSV